VAQALKNLGGEAVASFKILPPESTVEEAKARLAKVGYDAAWVVRLTDKAQDIYTTSTMYAPYGAYGSYWGWGGGWGAPYGSEVRTDTNYYIETLIYSVKLDELAWSGLSETTNPSNIDSFAAELVQVAIAELKETGLVK